MTSFFYSDNKFRTTVDYGFEIESISDTQLRIMPGRKVIPGQPRGSDVVILTESKTLSINLPFDPNNLTNNSLGITYPNDLPLEPYSSYHIFLIKGNEHPAAWATRSLTTPLPEGYSYKRHLTSVMLNQNGEILGFYQSRDIVHYRFPLEFMYDVVIPITDHAYSLPVPFGIPLICHLEFNYENFEFTDGIINPNNSREASPVSKIKLKSFQMWTPVTVLQGRSITITGVGSDTIPWSATIKTGVTHNHVFVTTHEAQCIMIREGPADSITGRILEYRLLPDSNPYNNLG